MGRLSNFLRVSEQLNRRASLYPNFPGSQHLCSTNQLQIDFIVVVQLARDVCTILYACEEVRECQ